MPRCECGVFGVFGHPEAAVLTSRGLSALQHRGQESAGVAVIDDDGQLSAQRGMGWVREVFSQSPPLPLVGSWAIGQTRYSTAGNSQLANAQPLILDDPRFGPLAIVHNGNLVNADYWRKWLKDRGARFASTSDTEVILHLCAHSAKETLEEAFVEALSQVKGAYSLLLLSREGIYAVRDPAGVRPLVLGTQDQAWVIASETSALNFLGARFVRSIAPGEILHLGREGSSSKWLAASSTSQFCLFEFVYVAHPDSQFEGKDVYEVRKALGRQLAREAPARRAEIVIPIPNSGICAALGYHEESGLSYEEGLMRNLYSDAGRTFIEPNEGQRAGGVRDKLTPVKRALRGRKVVMIDDSIVRGTTMRQIVTMVREAGAEEVHVRIASPPIRSPCYYGIDMQRRDELIAADRSVEEICPFIGADSLGYLSLEGLRQVIGLPDGCTACWSGQYRLPTPADETEYLRTVRKDPEIALT